MGSAARWQTGSGHRCGALAIAAGFGLQTLLKNFIAGIMLPFERPMPCRTCWRGTDCC